MRNIHCLNVISKYGTDLLRYIHQRTVLFCHSSLKEPALVQEIVQNLCLFLIIFLHSCQSALSLQPLKHLSADIDAISRADYVYICENNTIYGTKFKTLPNTKGKTLVADVSSCFLSEPVVFAHCPVMM